MNLKYIDCEICNKLVNRQRFALHCKGKKHQLLESEMKNKPGDVLPMDDSDDQSLTKDDTATESSSSSSGNSI